MSGILRHVSQPYSHHASVIDRVDQTAEFPVENGRENEGHHRDSSTAK